MRLVILFLKIEFFPHFHILGFSHSLHNRLPWSPGKCCFLIGRSETDKDWVQIVNADWLVFVKKPLLIGQLKERIASNWPT